MKSPYFKFFFLAFLVGIFFLRLPILLKSVYVEDRSIKGRSIPVRVTSSESQKLSQITIPAQFPKPAPIERSRLHNVVEANRFIIGNNIFFDFEGDVPTFRVKGTDSSSRLKLGVQNNGHPFLELSQGTKGVGVALSEEIKGRPILSLGDLKSPKLIFGLDKSNEDRNPFLVLNPNSKDEHVILGHCCEAADPNE